MSGNITPDRLLDTLKLLLSPAGGIRSRHEVCQYSSTLRSDFVSSTLLFLRVANRCFVSGRSPRIPYAKIFKEARVQSYLYQYIAVIFQTTSEDISC